MLLKLDFKSFKDFAGYIFVTTVIFVMLSNNTSVLRMP